MFDFYVFIYILCIIGIETENQELECLNSNYAQPWKHLFNISDIW